MTPHPTPATDREALLPCPFCGWQKIFPLDGTNNEFDAPYAECSRCGATGPEAGVHAWNTRTRTETEAAAERRDAWRAVSDYEGKYSVNCEGVIRAERGGIVGTWPNADGYLLARLSSPRRVVRVHVVVANAWVPNPDGKPFVGHLDNNPANPNANNLVWCTQAENLAHMDACARRAKPMLGRRSPFATLTNEQVSDIRGKYETGLYSHAKLAAEFAVSKRCIGRCIAGKSYRDV